MTITVFSLFTSFLWLNIFMLITIFASKRNALVKHFSLRGMLFLSLLCIVRIFAPQEFPFVININSTKVMPFICDLWTDVFYSFYGIPFSIKNIFLFVSLLGSFILAVRLLNGCIGFCRIVRRLENVTDNKIINVFNNARHTLNINKNIRLVYCAPIPSPVLVGLIHPVIILSDMVFSDEELNGILIHEMAHYKYKHVIFLFFVNLLCIIFWWNPVVWKFKKEVGKLLEFHADKKVCQFLNKEQQKSYLGAILKVTERTPNNTQSAECSVCLAEKDGGNAIMQRFKMILDGSYTYKNLKSNVIFAIGSTALVLFSYLFVIQPSYEPDLEAYNDGALVITPGSYIVKNEDTYSVFNADGELIVICEYPIDKSHEYMEIKNK